MSASINSSKKRQRSGSEDDNRKEKRTALSLPVRLGLISDTHGVLEESAVEYLNDIPSCRVVIHAGDVGDKRAGRLRPHELLDRLSSGLDDKIILACRGNVDDALSKKYSQLCVLPQNLLHTVPETGTRIFVLHGDGIPNKARIKNQKDGALQVTEEAWDMIQQHKAQIVIYGHSHSADCREYRDTLFINPGSAGPKRFKLPRSCGMLSLAASVGGGATQYKVEVHNLETGEDVLTKSGSLKNTSDFANYKDSKVAKEDTPKPRKSDTMKGVWRSTISATNQTA